MLIQTLVHAKMTSDRFAFCVLCERSEETNITGALSTKAGLTAHQNCLLFASGLACTTDKPEFDDLFGFSVKDVKKEVKRGRKLSCSRCRKRGAVSGCDIKRCHKSFHFPCAVEDEAEIIENSIDEEYRLLCSKHRQSDSVNGTQSQSANDSKKARRSKHASSSKRKSNAGESSAGQRSPSVSSSTSRTTSSSFKRRLSFNDRSEKKKAKRLLSDCSSNSDPGALIPPLDSDLDESTPPLTQTFQLAGPPSNSKDVDIPLGDPVEEVVTSDVKNHDFSIHSDAESESLLLPVSSHRQLQPNTEVLCFEKEVQTIKTEQEDFSPAPSPTHSPEKVTDEPVPEPPPSQGQSTPIPGSPHHTSSSVELAVCEPICVTYISSSSSSPVHPPPSPLEVPPSPLEVPPSPLEVPPSPLEVPPSPLEVPPSPLEVPPSDPNTPQVPPSDLDPALSMDSASFWRKCNMARCTQALFSEFVKEMNEICSRIQSDQASQEDYNYALSMMMSSGRLEAFVAKQNEELQRKRAELQEAAAAMKDIVSIVTG